MSFLRQDANSVVMQKLNQHQKQLFISTDDMFSASQNANISEFLHTFHSANVSVAQKLNLRLQDLLWFRHDILISSNKKDKLKLCFRDSAIFALLEAGNHCSYV